MTQLSDLVYIDRTGYHYADYPTFLDFLKQKYREIYGADVYLEADSQDGQLISIQARAMFDAAALGASVYNSFSPLTAQGTGLASVVKINGIKRRTPSKSTVDLTVVGVVGTNILNGIVEDSIGNKWLLPASVVIPISGSIVVTATAEKPGDINAQAGTVNKIFTPTLGWQTVTNVLAATPGVPVEEDADLRIRQSKSTALPSLSIFDGTVGAVENLSGIIRVKGYENDSGSTDGDGIPAHSIAIVVEGGDTQEIAEAIAIHKTPGTRTFGTTSAVVLDAKGLPNTINFFRPTIVGIKAEVQLTAFSGYLSDYETLIKQAIADAINALEIGQNVLITKLYVPANLPNTVAGETFDIISIEIAKLADSLAASNIVIDFDEAAECDISDISIVVVP